MHINFSQANHRSEHKTAQVTKFRLHSFDKPYSKLIVVLSKNCSINLVSATEVNSLGMPVMLYYESLMIINLGQRA